MKNIFFIITCISLCLDVRAGVIDSSGFDTNTFVISKTAGTVTLNTNSANPKAAATKGDLITATNNLPLSSETNAGLMPTNYFIRGEWIPGQQDGVSRLPILGIAAWFGDFDETSWMGPNGISNALWKANQTLYPFGYRYLILDDGWGQTNLDPNGLMQLDYNISNVFGAGTLGVSNFVYAIHTNGWKLGVYLDGGTNLSSAGFQHGMGGYLLWTNVASLQRYGIDFIKSIQSQTDEERLAGILAQNPYPVFLMSLANGNFGALYPTICNTWGTIGGTDVTSYTQLVRIMDIINTNNLWRWVVPGHYIDTDYIGAEANNGGGPLATKTHVVFDALISANIYDDAGFPPGGSNLHWFTNRDILAIDQDPAVICAQKFITTNNCDVYLKPLGSQTGPQYALGVVNRGLPATNVTLYFTNLNPFTGSTLWSAYDCVSNYWVFQGSNAFGVNLETNDCVLWRLVPGYAVQTNVISVNWPDSETVNVVSNGTQLVAYTAIDNDASNYIARAGITNSQTEMLAASEAVALGKQHGWWNNLDALYLFRGSTSNSCAQNLISSSYGIKWSTSGVTFGWQGVTGDGSAGYGDTQFTPSTAGGKFSLNSATLFVYNQTAQPSGGTLTRFMGAIGGPRSEIVHNSATTVASGGFNNSVANTGSFGTNTGTGSFSGIYVWTRTSSTLMSLYKDNGLGQFDTSVTTSLPTASIYFLASDSGGLFGPIGATFSAAGIGGGMNVIQWNTFRTDMNTIQNILRLKIPGA